MSREELKKEGNGRPAGPFSFPPVAWIWLLVSAVVIVLDWHSKQWASQALELYRPREVLSWLNITLAHNYGAAFSFLADAGGWQRWFFTILASVVSLILIIWLKRLPENEKLNAVALALIIGGAVGNLIDRIAYGHVIDFLLVYYQQWSWPAFNVADSAISIGVALMLMAMFRFSPSSPE